MPAISYFQRLYHIIDKILDVEFGNFQACCPSLYAGHIKKESNKVCEAHSLAEQPIQVCRRWFYNAVSHILYLGLQR